MTVIAVILAVLVVLTVVALASTRVLREYQRGVCFRLGRLRPLTGPGPVFLLPFIDRLIRVDLRTVLALEFGSQCGIPAYLADLRDAVRPRGLVNTSLPNGASPGCAA